MYCIHLTTAASIEAFYAKTMLHFLEGMLHGAEGIKHSSQWNTAKSNAGSVVADHTLAHPLNCRGGVVAHLSAQSCTRVLNLGLTHEGYVLLTRSYRPSQKVMLDHTSFLNILHTLSWNTVQTESLFFRRGNVS